jgi:hypothetical protein
MAATTRTWLWIIFGVIGFVAICLVALVAGGAYVVSRHVKTELVGKISAEEQFVRQRARFAGQLPLIDVQRADSDDVEAKVRRPAEDARRVELKTMRVLVYDSHDGRLVHIDLPFWLLRFMPPGSLNKTGGSDFSFDSGHVTIDDIERHGPGLILDARDSRDAQILIWTE